MVSLQVRSAKRNRTQEETSEREVVLMAMEMPMMKIQMIAVLPMRTKCTPSSSARNLVRNTYKRSIYLTAITKIVLAKCR
jgi:hypothetical protein